MPLPDFADTENPLRADRTSRGLHFTVWSPSHRQVMIAVGDNCPIMLRASLLADAKILPLATQGSYFFNRIGQKLHVDQTVAA
ncbi:hypothetical protein [Pseudomonas chlororaphis]|uniref:hypothetical protein n=1 Tax=Pseudomonas chlororaphis TaxID=587753 RepID=UPI0012D3255C|nr:hypothetical protein [Pseudomonas chlororaphis]